MPPSPIKNEDQSITVRGKTYAIVSNGQYIYIRDRTLEDVYAKAAEKQETLTQEDAKDRLAKRMDECGFATLSIVLAKMTPDERERWKAQYRFCHVTRHQGRAGGM
jgi:hypothetical protein